MLKNFKIKLIFNNISSMNFKEQQSNNNFKIFKMRMKIYQV